jgi:hypothetical protein
MRRHVACGDPSRIRPLDDGIDIACESTDLAAIFGARPPGTRRISRISRKVWVTALMKRMRARRVDFSLFLAMCRTTV